jgi:hypothetical protein
VLVAGMARTTATVPTDTLGNTYVLDKAYVDSGYSTWSVAIYRTVCGSTGANTVTVTRAGSDHIDCVAEERDDIAATPLDMTSQANTANWGNGSDTHASTGTLSQADEVVYAMVCGRCTPGTAPGTFTSLPAPTGFTDLGTQYLGAGTYTTPPSGLARMVVSATTALAPVWSPTISGTNNWPTLGAMVVATYKLSGGGGGGSTRGMPFDIGTAFGGGRTLRGPIC